MILRGPISSHDWGTAVEIFADAYYTPPATFDESPPLLIVDAGSNIGLSLIYWAKKFPTAQLLSFEPHPDHLSLLRKNLRINNVPENAVTVVESAVGSSNRMSWLSDEGSSSAVRDGTIPRSTDLAIRVVDIFEQLSGRTIDILKMDIEGSEREILDDVRMSRLNIKHIVFEWHSADSFECDPEVWYLARLQSLGFRCRTIFSKHGLGPKRYGMLWATKLEQPHQSPVEANGGSCSVSAK